MDHLKIERAHYPGPVDGRHGRPVHRARCIPSAFHEPDPGIHLAAACRRKARRCGTSASRPCARRAWPRRAGGACSAGWRRPTAEKPELVARLSKMIEATPAEGFMRLGRRHPQSQHHGPAQGHHAADARHRRRGGPGDAAGGGRGDPPRDQGLRPDRHAGRVAHAVRGGAGRRSTSTCSSSSTSIRRSSATRRPRWAASSCSAATAPSVRASPSGWRACPGSS